MMPEIGDIQRGDIIGYKGHSLFIYQACMDCGKTRWVSYRRGKPVRLVCGKCAVRGQRGKGAASHHWKGGRTISGGYIFIHVEPGDFFYSMVNYTGYVREHRLVMAKHLKRCLLPWEVVHHKGIKYALGSIENRQDNRVENLALLGSNGIHNKEIERLIKQAWKDGYEAGYARQEDIADPEQAYQNVKAGQEKAP